MALQLNIFQFLQGSKCPKPKVGAAARSGEAEGASIYRGPTAAAVASVELQGRARASDNAEGAAAVEYAERSGEQRRGPEEDQSRVREREGQTESDHRPGREMSCLRP